MLGSRWPWKPEPDCEGLLATLGVKRATQPVQVLEFLVDPEIVHALLQGGVLPDRKQVPTTDSVQNSILDLIHLYYSLGFSAFRAKALLDLPTQKVMATDTATYSRIERGWVNEQHGLVTTWDEFDAYPWPRTEEADFRPLEYAIAHLPEGMTIFAKSYGIPEQAMFLMGYESFAYCLYDDPDLVEAVFSKIEEIYLPFNFALTQIEGVSGLWMGDDMGYRSGTMIHPDHLRKYVFPLHEQVAKYCHDHGILFLIHSCGNLEAIMEDLISDVRIDSKHSFEDAILPVEHFVEKYGKRISTIGGLDVDLLARGSETNVRARVQEILTACSGSGSYVLGSGNSITNYVKPSNFLAMIDECRCFNEENF